MRTSSSKSSDSKVRELSGSKCFRDRDSQARRAPGSPSPALWVYWAHGIFEDIDLRLFPSKTMSLLNVNLRFLVYREDETWLAHCLEMDIVAEGDTPESAVSDLVDLCNFQIATAMEDG